MCGISSILKKTALYILSGTLERMARDIRHRGPDDEGIVFLSSISANVWQHCSLSTGEWEVALGSCRLSILDLSKAGHMPMAYQERFWIVYNGEVYNVIEIRAELEKLGHVFHSSCDTEVILVAYVERGTDCFTRFRGMWGLVIFDASHNEVILYRDRLAIKPLYLWQSTGIVAIASEIKQFLHLPSFTPHMNPAVAAEYLRTGYEESDKTFFRDVHPVPAGSWLRISLDKQGWRLEEICNMFLPRLLKWDDRNAMAFSVERRYPFLDHELIELCLSFAPRILYRSG